MDKLFGSLCVLLALSACAKDEPTDSRTQDTGAQDCEQRGELTLCVLTGTLLSDMTLSADTAWLLRGGVFVGDGQTQVTLSIEPGTVVYGETSTDGMLVIERGSKILAEGTALAPIVFTSSNPEGTRARGDWGGLILNGRAPLNVCDGVEEAPDPCEAFGEGGTGTYGGDDPADSSGVLKYVRVEFGGTLLSPENELNGVAFQGVGSGTVVDYLQVHKNDDDGVEFFGGTVSVSHLVVSGVGDDSLDWTDGWQGSARYVVLQQDGDGDNGIEGDNNGDNNEASPRSGPTLRNLSIIGAPDSEKSDMGILLREGTGAHLESVLVQGFNDACFAMNHQATWDTLQDGGLSVMDLVASCEVFVDPETKAEDYTGAQVEDWLLEAGNQSLSGALVQDGYNLSEPVFLPVSGLEGVGAMPDGDDWSAGWTSYPQN